MESREDFDMRMMNTVSRLESRDTVLFYKLVSRSMATEVVQGPFAYSLEFPIDFIKQHGKKFEKDVTFGIKDSERTWPIKLTVRSFKRSRARVFAYGDGGWKTFLMDNQIKVGDILIFTLRSYSRFHVIIGRAPVEIHSDDDDEGNMEENDNEDNNNDNKWFVNTSPWWNADRAPDSCRVCKQAPPCPRFVVTIRNRHSSLAVPGRFWEFQRNMLERNEMQLKGPNKAICKVKAKRTYDEEEKKLCVCLDSGWEAFRVANKLRVGDVLEFLLVGRSCFTVVLLERIEK